MPQGLELRTTDLKRPVPGRGRLPGASGTRVGKRRSKKLQLVPTLGNLQIRSGTVQATHRPPVLPLLGVGSLLMRMVEREMVPLSGSLGLHTYLAGETP